MFIYRLTEPIDLFDGLTPLNRWLAGSDDPTRTSWAIAAVLALRDAADHVGWRGDMRHLPMIGALPTTPGTTPYLLVKQDNNGDTFLITDAEPHQINQPAAHTHVTTRIIGAWTPDTTTDSPAF
jgi:hypothetical protein